MPPNLPARRRGRGAGHGRLSPECPRHVTSDARAIHRTRRTQAEPAPPTASRPVRAGPPTDTVREANRRIADLRTSPATVPRMHVQGARGRGTPACVSRSTALVLHDDVLPSTLGRVSDRGDRAHKPCNIHGAIHNQCMLPTIEEPSIPRRVHDRATSLPTAATGPASDRTRIAASPRRWRSGRPRCSEISFGTMRFRPTPRLERPGARIPTEAVAPSGPFPPSTAKRRKLQHAPAGAACDQNRSPQSPGGARPKPRHR